MLGDRIYELRKQRGLSQVDLAKALGVTKQSVSNWENSNIQPSIDLLVRIAQFFSVTTDYLLGLDNRRYIEVTKLDDIRITHIQMLVNDMQAESVSACRSTIDYES